MAAPPKSSVGADGNQGPARRTSTGEDCYQKLRRLLIYSQIPEGTRIGEIEWTQRLGVHRVALREAMALLSHEGLLNRGLRGGFFVPFWGQQDWREIWETRMVFEVGAVRLMSKHAPAADALRSLLGLCETQRQLLDAGMILGFSEADRKFHETLVELAGNDRLRTMYLRSALPHFMPTQMDPDEIRQECTRTLEQNHAIYAALVKRRYDEAARLLEEQLGGRAAETKRAHSAGEGEHAATVASEKVRKRRVAARSS